MHTLLVNLFGHFLLTFSKNYTETNFGKKHYANDARLTLFLLKGALQSFFSQVSIVYIFCYCRYLTCASRHACVFRCAEVLIFMDTACKTQPNESPWSPLLKVAFRLKNDCRALSSTYSNDPSR